MSFFLSKAVLEWSPVFRIRFQNPVVFTFSLSQARPLRPRNPPPRRLRHEPAAATPPPRRPPPPRPSPPWSPPPHPLPPRKRAAVAATRASRFGLRTQNSNQHICTGVVSEIQNSSKFGFFGLSAFGMNSCGSSRFWNIPAGTDFQKF